VSDIRPQMIAAAIADLGGDVVRESWHFAECYRVLGAAGVPPLELRHGLEQVERPTEPLAIMRKWGATGARGLLIFCGKNGRGKSHAGVRWAIERREHRLTTLWLPCADYPAEDYGWDERGEKVWGLQSAWKNKAKAARALVLDDIGAAETKRSDAQSAVEGVLMHRIAAGLPTMLISNAEEAEIKRWLGGRIMSRLNYGGGLHAFNGGKDLRETMPPLPDLDSFGRSPRLARALELLDVIGCEDDGDRLLVGRTLEYAGTNAACVRACNLLGLDRAVVRARAAAMMEADRELIRRTCAEYDVETDVADLTYTELREVFVRIIDAGTAKREAAARARNAELAALRTSCPARIIHAPEVVTAALARSCRELAERYNMRVVPSHDGVTWCVRQSAEGQVLAAGFVSEDHGWWAAAELLRPALEGSAAS
jgi:hypothetical protein